METRKVAVVIGASRGIGRVIALHFAKANYRVVVAAKTENTKASEGKSSSFGSIHSVCAEINDSVLQQKRGTHVQSADKEGWGNPGKTQVQEDEPEVVALPVRCDVRNPNDIERLIKTTLTVFGRIDVMIYNAGAIFWNTISNTNLKRFNLLQEVNINGLYATVRYTLPHFLKQKSGCFIVVSPPIYSRFFKGKIAYAIGKVGMTVLTMGLGKELEGTGVMISSLWPATGIESAVTDKNNVDKRNLRRADIFAESCLRIAASSSSPELRETLNGQAFIDEDYLRQFHSFRDEDFVKYRCDPEHEPPRMMPRNFPSLKVEEEDYAVFPKLKSKI
ncbi:hypothetical protein HK102_002542 [Quaeritorhiza haematococci]|nr:hypothetical protein HK102_002542 [Quaeritorhiza haematococci]